MYATKSSLKLSTILNLTIFTSSILVVGSANSKDLNTI